MGDAILRADGGEDVFVGVGRNAEALVHEAGSGLAKRGDAFVEGVRPWFLAS